jgi:hypothetical protein
MHLQLIGKLARVAAAAVSLAACIPPMEPQYANNPAFARRAPPAGRPSYLETVKYVDDGMRYADPTTAFFVSSDGRMCFRGVLNAERTNLEYFYKSDWCLPPTSVYRVDSIRTGEVSLICKHADPRCVREIGYRDRGSNTVAIHVVPSDQEKVAVEHLIYLMGGNLGEYQPFTEPIRLKPGR